MTRESCVCVCVSCHTYEWVMSHISCHTYEWVMSHIWVSHVTQWVFLTEIDLHEEMTSESYVWHDSFIRVTWRIHMCDVTYSYVRHDPLISERRDSLLVSTTHCNTLQHTATHCNTLQNTATHAETRLIHFNGKYNTLPHTASLQHTATHCNTLQHTATHCNTRRDSPYSLQW